MDGYGIDSISKIFTDYGYTPRDELRFPAKKLKAKWFAPPDIHDNSGKMGSDGPLPRIFISELCVDELSSQSRVSLKNAIFRRILYSYNHIPLIYQIQFTGSNKKIHRKIQNWEKLCITC